MQTKLSTKGQVIIPAELREKYRLRSGEVFDVTDQDGKLILSPVKRKRNQGVVKLLLSCPPGLKIPPRDKSPYRKPLKF